jgi:polyphosphate kinase 2 (PPK2 family)
MGFYSDAQHKAFLESAPEFEAMLAQSGVTLIKYWLDISREEQEERLTERKTGPLKGWKVSNLDKVALENSMITALPEMKCFWRQVLHTRHG